jgi:hypothetical protein
VTVARHLEAYSTRRELKTPGDRARAAFRLVSSWLAEGKKPLDAVNALDPKRALLDRQGFGAHPGWLLLVGADDRTRHVARIRTQDGQRLIDCRCAHEDGSPEGDLDPARVDSVRRRRLQLGDGT